MIWRGAGIAVPIIFFICGWIVSYWFEDTRLGNPDFMGWTSFYAGIVTLLAGVVILGMGSEPKKLEPGEVPVRVRHDFFWIPVLIWGVILLGLSIYLLI